MRKNKFFDTIMIALILMIGFRIIFPNAFSGVGSSSDLPASPYVVTLPHYDTIGDAMAYYVSLDGAHCEYDDFNPGFVNGTSLCGPFFSSLETVRIDYSFVAVASLIDNMRSPAAPASLDSDSGTISSVGAPVFYVGDTLWYMHAASLSEIWHCDIRGDSGLSYTINSDDASQCYAPFSYV